jgi:hypothetical protein
MDTSITKKYTVPKFNIILAIITELIFAFFVLGEIGSALNPTGSQSTGLWLFVAAISIALMVYVWWIMADLRPTITVSGGILVASRGPFFRRKRFSIDLNQVAVIEGGQKQFMTFAGGFPVRNHTWVFALRTPTNGLEIPLAPFGLKTRRQIIETIFLPLIQNPQVRKAGQLKEAIHAMTKSLLGAGPVDSLLPPDLV